MAGNAGLGDDPLAPGCYSQLLFGDEVSGLDTDSCFAFTSSFSSDDNSCNNPKMLCFGDYESGKKMDHKPGFTCMDSSPKNTPLTKKRNGWSIQNARKCGGKQRDGKKPKSENLGGGGGHAKVVKKEKLGERVTALQQLVSPFGKTDTASVLHEALGYIRFLHDQVQVLCSPYLQRSSPSSSQAPNSSDDEGSKKSKDNLRSRGLCLVPVDLTLHVADSNGADLWSSATLINTVSSS